MMKGNRARTEDAPMGFSAAIIFGGLFLPSSAGQAIQDSRALRSRSRDGFGKKSSG
jgi:hypothetical protein